MQWSHFILGVFNKYVLTSNTCSYCIAKHLLLLRWDMGKVRDRFGGMGRFKGGLRCKVGVNSAGI